MTRSRVEREYRDMRICLRFLRRAEGTQFRGNQEVADKKRCKAVRGATKDLVGAVTKFVATIEQGRGVITCPQDQSAEKPTD